MSFILSNADALMRPDLERAYEDMAYGGQFAAILALVEKADKSGDSVNVPIKLGVGAGAGATANTAYVNAQTQSTVRKAFNVTPFKTYQMEIVDLSSAAYANADDNAAADLLLDEVKSAMDGCKMQWDQMLASDGSGTIFTSTAVVNTSGTTWTVTSGTSSDLNNIGVGDILVSKSTPFNGTLDNTGATFTVTNVNAGTKTITGTTSGTLTAGHVFGRQGTMQGTTGFVAPPGFLAWIPPAASRPVASTLFYNLDRSTDERRLAGCYYDGTADGYLEGINILGAQVAQVPGAKVDIALMSFAAAAKIRANLQTQARYVNVKGPGVEVYKRCQVIDGPTGELHIVESAHWPDNYILLLDSSTWVYGSPGNKPFVAASAEGKWVENIPGQDQAVCAVRGHGFFYSTAPGRSGMLTVKP